MRLKMKPLKRNLEFGEKMMMKIIDSFYSLIP
jgi:hypothetical protein